MVRVLVTGISGFIGSHLAERLVEESYEVYGVVRRVANRKLEVFQKISEDVELITGDITDHASVCSVLRTVDPDIVVHLAALTPVRDSFERPFEYQKANLIGTMNFAHGVLQLSDTETRRLIAASTAEVYGLQEKASLKEELALKPTSPYAVSKAAADLYLQMMSHTYGLNCTILRPTNSYGRKFDTSFLIEYLVVHMLKDEKVYVGAPNSIRDYMYVDDHVDAYLRLIKSKDAIGKIYNAGTGVGTSNKALAEEIAEKIGYSKKKIILGSYPRGYPYRPQISDQPSIILDPSKIKRDLGWTAKVSLSEGIEKVISNFKDGS